MLLPFDFSNLDIFSSHDGAFPFKSNEWCPSFPKIDLFLKAI